MGSQEPTNMNKMKKNHELEFEIPKGFGVIFKLVSDYYYYYGSFQGKLQSQRDRCLEVHGKGIYVKHHSVSFKMILTIYNLTTSQNSFLYFIF